jgi:hypothetical protein
LSEENNRPDMAMDAATEALARAGRPDVSVHLSSQRVPMGPISMGLEDPVDETTATGVSA